jgi:hypothetical protein
MAYDVFFLSHDEPLADSHWQRLQQLAPHARRIDGIDGIRNAHRQCARLARTSLFFVVDADNEVLDFDFRIRIPVYDQAYVHVWRAMNPVNNLIYGWGGIKLFPRKLLLDEAVMPLDMTSSFPMKIVEQIGSITRFNTSGFDAWRSAFRECVKLSVVDTIESRERLHIWCSVANGDFAEDCLRGAREGHDFARTHPADVGRINDWAWLRARYNATRS